MHRQMPSLGWGYSMSDRQAVNTQASPTKALKKRIWRLSDAEFALALDILKNTPTSVARFKRLRSLMDKSK
jgi:hypothetical protein